MLDQHTSTESLSHRARLAQLIRPLKRVRPRVPFYQLAAHRIPTLWTLYRGLLREAPGENIRFRITMLFRHYQHLTSPAQAKKQLILGHKWLEIFRNARDGNERLQTILLRYDQMLYTKRQKERMKEMAKDAIAWQMRLRNRPILTGAYLRPTLYNGPLPRMRRQPTALSMMIYRRRLARARRGDLAPVVSDWIDDLRHERAFEEELERQAGEPVENVFRGDFAGWCTPLNSLSRWITASFALEAQRQRAQYPPELLETIKQARRERIANKTRERERERRGEVLPCTIARRNRGPPAQVLRRMSSEDRKLYKIAQGVSEVGYVGRVKRKLGFKLRDPNAWKREGGLPENQEELQRVEKMIREESERRALDLDKS